MAIKSLIDQYLNETDIDNKETILAQIQDWTTSELVKIASIKSIIHCQCGNTFNIVEAEKTNWIIEDRNVICTYFDPLDIIGSEYALQTTKVKYAICPHCGAKHEYQRNVEVEDD